MAIRALEMLMFSLKYHEWFVNFLARERTQLVEKCINYILLKEHKQKCV